MAFLPVLTPVSVPGPLAGYFPVSQGEWPKGLQALSAPVFLGFWGPGTSPHLGALQAGLSHSSLPSPEAGAPRASTIPTCGGRVTHSHHGLYLKVSCCPELQWKLSSHLIDSS
jgi:hypothetical protein